MDVDGPKLAAGMNGTGGLGGSTGATSPVGEVARSDVSLPKRERRRSFLARNQKIQALKDLPHLKDTSLQRREVSCPVCFCHVPIASMGCGLRLLIWFTYNLLSLIP